MYNPIAGQCTNHIYHQTTVQILAESWPVVAIIYARSDVVFTFARRRLLSRIRTVVHVNHVLHKPGSWVLHGEDSIFYLLAGGIPLHPSEKPKCRDVDIQLVR